MNPYFLIGAERSGTTLLRLMLDAHPLISWTHEFEYVVKRIDSPNSWPDMSSYIDWLTKNWSFLATGFKIDRTLDYPSLIKSFLTQKQGTRPIVGATCHTHYDRLLRLFPNAKFIYLLRDPRDVARSNIGMGWAGNVWTGVDRWIEAVNLWERVKQKLEKDKSYIDVKFEQLIVSPEETLSAICNFMNIDYDSKMMSYPEYTTYSKVDIDIVGRWKSKMTKREIRLVEYKCQGLMEKGGYKLISNNMAGPTIIDKLYLRIQDRFYRIKFRMKRYGLRLFFCAFFARRLKIKKLQHKFNIKMREVDIKYIK